MKAETIYQAKFLPVAKYLLKELEYYGETQFRKKTEVSGWTIGQLYDHLIEFTYDNHIKAIRDCLEQRNGSLQGSKTVKGFFYFLTRSYPAGRKKGKPGYTPVQLESPAKAKDMMFGYIKEMHRIASEIDKKNLKYKVRHEKLGMLSAIEWYMLIEMHQRHHLKQKHRIDKVLREFRRDEVFGEAAV